MLKTALQLSAKCKWVADVCHALEVRQTSAITGMPRNCSKTAAVTWHAGLPLLFLVILHAHIIVRDHKAGAVQVTLYE
jgi:hypothetical protein